MLNEELQEKLLSVFDKRFQDYNTIEKVADERMSTILDIEKYCIDEKEDLISGCEVCEDILKMIDKLKGKKYYIKKTYTKRQIDKLKKKYENAVADYEKTRFEKEQLNSLVNSCQEEIRQLKKQLDKYENPEDMTLMMMWCTEKVKEENQKLQTIANNCKQLKDNWNKLKVYIKTEIPEDVFIDNEWFVSILDKIQELESENRNE